MKIKAEAFKELCNEATSQFYANYQVNKWKGFRLIAIDGSEVILPRNEETIKEYGEYLTNFMKKTIVMARMSKAYDVLNNITIDAEIVNRKIGEHTLANKHLKHIKEGDLILSDRGYPSYDLFKNTLNAKAQFCSRLAVSNWSIAKKLVNSIEKDIIAEIKPGNELKKRYKEDGTKHEPIRCRFVCIELSTGVKEVLITSLLDQEKYPYEIFEELYFLRWPVEESYKKDKHRLQLENFSGETVIAIQQDFHAKITLGNITAILSSNLEFGINKKAKKTKYKYKVNMTSALAKVKETIALLFTQENIYYLLEKIANMFIKNTSPIRPNRSFERHIHKRKRYHRTYLTL